LLVCLIATLFSATAAIAQSSESDPRPINRTVNANSGLSLETEPTAPVAIEERRPRTVTASAPARAVPIFPAISLTARFDQSLLTAIQSHVGANYHFNRTGPEEFDCSGLVWRAFQDVGVNFQRGPARSYWATFEAPPKSEEFKFGTLVFFSNLSHVGIVVDEKGFYHSARHGGVMYSPFNEYWLSRIDGFRRVPVQSLQATTPATKPRTTSTNVASVEQNNEP